MKQISAFLNACRPLCALAAHAPISRRSHRRGPTGANGYAARALVPRCQRGLAMLIAILAATFAPLHAQTAPSFSRAAHFIDNDAVGGGMSVVFKGIVAGAIPNNSAASRAVPAPATVGTDNGADPTVNPTPVSQAAGPATVAYGAPINLTVAPTYPGARYVWVWDGPTPWGSSEQNPTFPTPRTPGPFDPGPAPVIPGMHRFTVTVTLGTCSYSSFVDVTVLPSTLPHLTLTDVGPVLCPGASDLTYTVTGNPFPAGTTIRAELSSPSHSYSKIIGSTDLGGLGTHTLKVKVPHLRPRTSSYYRVELSASSPFDADSKTTSITDVPPLDSLQVSSNSPVMAGDTVKLKASYSSAYGSQPFAWTFTPVGGSPRFFSNEYNPRIPNAQAAQSGRYHVTANGYFGCTDTASVRVLVIPCGCS